MKGDNISVKTPGDWDFSPLETQPSGTIKACLVYEYARETSTLRNLSRNWDEFCETHPKVNLRSLWPFAFSDGCFPNKTWMKLSESEINSIAPYLSRVDMVAVKGLDVAVRHYFPDYVKLDAGSIQTRGLRLKHPFGQWFEDNWAQSCNPSPFGPTAIGEADNPRTLPPGQSSEYFFAVIHPETWRLYTNDQIGDFLKTLVAPNRPNTIPQPMSQRGRFKSKDMFAALRWLGAMRLMHKVGWPKAKEIAQLENRGSLFFEANLRTNRWSDRITWRNAADRAKQKMHELFPFLPDEEVPLSYNSKGLDAEFPEKEVPDATGRGFREKKAAEKRGTSCDDPSPQVDQ